MRDRPVLCNNQGARAGRSAKGKVHRRSLTNYRKQQAKITMSNFQPLLGGSLSCLAQCRSLLEIIEPEMLARTHGSSATVGTHLRHILERFQCLLTGLPARLVDYDQRPRNRRLEVDLPLLREALLALEPQLQGLDTDDLGQSLTIRESVHRDCDGMRRFS